MGDLYLLSSENYKQYYDIQRRNTAQKLSAIFSLSNESLVAGGGGQGGDGVQAGGRR